MGNDDSLPVHVGTAMLDAVLDLKQEVGSLGGKIDGLNKSVGDLHGRVSQSMTRDECASLMANTRHQRKPSAETAPAPAPDPKPESWWKGAQTKLAVILATITLLALVGGAGLWMFNAYQTLSKAQVALQRLDGGSR